MSRTNNGLPIIKDRVKELLKKRKKTQLDLAKAINYDKDHLNKSLRTHSINREFLIKIAEYLNCDPRYLIDEDFPLLEYANFEAWQFNHIECIKGLIYRAQFNARDYDLKEYVELEDILILDIIEYSEKKNKKYFDIAFWDGESSDSGAINIDFKKEGDTDGLE